MPSLVDLVGEKLLSKEGPIETSSLCQAKDEVIGLYFSAHWCPPCRAFTPQLAEFYKKLNKDGTKMKIIFVSSDKNQKEFDDYFAEMPWYALPYENRDKKNDLSRRCKVSGIPTLVLFDSECQKLQTEGNIRQLISTDPEGKGFPWPQASLSQLLTGPLTDKNGGSSSIEDLLKEGYTLGIYFSAHWCPPCRMFTPQLVQTYEKVKEKGNRFEIIFASSDQDEDAFKDYLDSMPWKAIPYEDERKEKLSNRFDVEGIPTLVIVSSDGKVITTNGRSCVSSDKEGENFPWNAKPVNSLSASTDHLNDVPCLMLFTEGSNAEAREVASSLLLPVAEKLGKAAMPDNDEAEILFICAGGEADEGLKQKVRDFAQLPTKEQKPSLLVILDIPRGQCYVHEPQVTTADDIENVVNDFRAKKLTFRGLKD